MILDGFCAVSPAHAGVEATSAIVPLRISCQPRARGGRGARAEKIQEQIGSAPRTRG